MDRVFEILFAAAKAMTVVWPSPAHKDESLEQGWRRLFREPKPPKPLFRTRMEGVDCELYARGRLLMRDEHHTAVYQLRLPDAAPTVAGQLLDDLQERISAFWSSRQ